MTKRLFAMLLVLVMVLSMMPTSVWAEGTGTPTPQADGPHTHKVCNGSALCADCAHTDVTYEPLTDVSKLSTTSGNYYLTEDLVLTSQINIAANLDIKLCLNGFNIRAASGKNIRFFNINNNNVKLTVSNCGEKKNEAGVQKGVVTGAKDAIMFAGNNSAGSQIAFYNVIFDNNTGVGAAGTGSNSTMQLNSTASLTAVGCDFTNNYSNTAGVVRLYGAGAVDLVGCTLTGNRGKYGYALYLNKGTVTLTDTVIEGNYAYSADGVNNGAVYITADATVNFTVQGKTKIWGNSNKTTADGTGEARDLAFKNVSARQPKVKIGAKGLAEDAKIGIFLQSERLATDPYITGTLGGKDYTKNFAANNGGYQIFTESDKLVMKEAVVQGHTHKVCNGDAACASCAHTNVTYLPWGDPAKGEDKELPTSGDYYLTSDVTLSDQVKPTDTLNLCLNGHTITVKAGTGKRHFYLEYAANLNLTNCDSDKEGVLTGGQDSSILTSNDATKGSTGTVSLYNIVLRGNSRNSAGGAICMQKSSNLTMVGCKMENNTGTSGAAIYNYSSGKVTLIGCEIKNNTASNVKCAVNVYKGSLALIDTVIEGNTNTGKSGDAAGGAVWIHEACTNFTVEGATRITGNKDKDGNAANLYLPISGTKAPVMTIGENGLTGNALIGVTLQAARLSAADGMVITAKLNGANPVSHLASDNAAYLPVIKDDVVILGSADAYTHKHKLCNDGACADHAEVSFLPWGDGADEDKSLPTSGNYYLTKDVSLSAQTKLSGTELNLCLNGHTVTVKEGSGARHFYLEKDAKLAVTNCDTEKEGILTGGEKSSIMTANSAGATIELYNIVLQGNEYQSGGGGALMTQAAANATLVGCKLLSNSATGAGGAIRHYGSGTVTLIGCEVKGNTAKTSSAIRVENGGGKLVLIDTVIEGNSTTTDEALNYGALYAPNNKYTITVEGKTRITGNTDKDGNAANVYFQNSAGNQGVLTIGENGLSGNALIGVGMDMARVYNLGNVVTANAVAAGTEQYFTGDSAELNRVIRNSTDGKLYLAGNHADHALCVNADCTAHSEHTGEVWLPWAKTASLPTSGNFYLTENVQLNGVHNMQTAGTLNLCLNGHKITAKNKNGTDRHFALADGVTLSITDCTGNGVVSGGNRNFGGGVVNVNAGATFNFYGGNMTGNKAIKNAKGRSDGGVVYLTPANDGVAGGIFNMYGGKISGNSSEDLGGAIFVDTGATANIYAGEISENEANRGGAIYVKGTANIYGGKISENTAADRAGAIFLSGGTLNLSGGEISGHTAKTAIVAASKAAINMTGGKITGNKGTSGGAIIMESAGTKMTMSGGQITGNSASYGSGIYASTNTTFEMTGGVISGNEATNTGAGLHLLRSNVTLAGGEIKNNTAGSQGAGIEIEGATLTVTGTKITGNTAGTNGGGIYIASTKSGDVTYQPSVTLAGGEITGNTAASLGGGVATKDDKFTKLELSGNLVITGNRAGNKTSNLYLPGKAVFTVGALGENAKVGISAARVYGAMSAKTDTDCTAAFVSDNSALKVIYKDNTVYLQPADGHTHCVCLDQNADCKHEATQFAAWSDPTKLPSTPGNYYLTVDVKLGAVCNVFDDINLCLNGHTITPKKNERTFAVSPGATLSVTDCTGKGMITGGIRNYGGVINVNQGATFNLYGGNLTGNRTVKMDGEAGKAGAVYVTKATDDQPGGVFNMYGGSITENKTFWGGAVYVCDGAIMNLYGGTIANNEAMDRAGAICGDGKATINLYGGTITGNTAAKGGAIYVRNGSHINMAGAVITKNKTNATVWEEKQIAKASGGAAIALTNQSTMTMSGGEISYNEGKGAGGAVIMESKDTKFTMTGGKFLGNTTTSDGGAIYVSTNTVFEMSGGEITKNTSKKNGGGIYFLRSTGTITGGSINSNISTDGAGGGIGMARATVTIKGGSVSYNTVKTAKSAKGGGIMMNGATLNIYGGSMVGNTLPEKGTGGSAICTSTASETKNGVKTTFYSKINMYGGTISGHTGRYGGALLLQSQTVMNMYGGTMRNNHAVNEGGAACLYSKSTFNMSGGSIVDNTSDDRGGGLKFNAGTTGTFTGGTATGNYAAKYGGFFNAHGIDAKITMKDMKVYGNECKNYGGGIAITWNAILDMDDCEFYDNVGGEGGAMYLAHKTTCYLDNVKVYKNFSNDAGGAFYLDVGNNINFTNVKILDNESVGNGGAIYTRANLHLKDCVIDGNVSGKDGGAIATSAAWTYGNLPEHTNGYVGRGQGTIIENCKITNNTCVGRGGGAFMAKKNWNTILDSEFSGNVSGETGSALFVGDDLLIKGMTVTGNTSKTDGYAVYFRENSYDGQSYQQAVHEMGGNVIVKDNTGGDMYLCEKVTIGNIVEGYGKDTYINVGLSDGVLTNRIFGEYDYEGGNLVYTMTYGSRSWTEPEVDTARVNANKDKIASGDIWLYVGLGTFVAVVAVVVILILAKKKKAGKPAEVPQE